jgi:K(+)-stimulated pyrophosphate-energized sodium pump
MADFVRAYDLTIMNPKLIGGLFIGGMMAFVFCAMTMKAVGRAAGAMVEEVRRQFKNIPASWKARQAGTMPAACRFPPRALSVR